MNRGQVTLSLVLVPAAIGLCCFYRYGHWSFGPSSPAARDVCVMRGGQEADLLLVHRCSSDQQAPGGAAAGQEGSRSPARAEIGS